MGRRRSRLAINAGDTFLLIHQSYNHLYVVCSEPAKDSERILIVNFTTFKPLEEDCCTVMPGEHPFIKHKSCIRYKDARIISVRQIETLLSGSLMSKRESVSPELLARVRDGASKSDWLPEEYRRLLENQELI